MSSPAPLTIGRRNAEQMTGMSWVWCLRFAAAHDVRIYRVGARKQLIDARGLLEAIAKNSEQPAAEPADDRAAMMRRLDLELVS